MSGVFVQPMGPEKEVLPNIIQWAQGSLKVQYHTHFV